MGAIEDLTDLLQRVKAQGKTIIIAEHRIWYLMDVADRVVYMHGGKILKDMTLNDFQALPESEILARGLRCRSLSHVKKTAIAPKTSSNELEVQGISVRLGKRTIFQDLSLLLMAEKSLLLLGKTVWEKQRLPVSCVDYKK